MSFHAPYSYSFYVTRADPPESLVCVMAVMVQERTPAELPRCAPILVQQHTPLRLAFPELSLQLRSAEAASVQNSLSPAMRASGCSGTSQRLQPQQRQSHTGE